MNNLIANSLKVLSAILILSFIASAETYAQKDKKKDKEKKEKEEKFEKTGTSADNFLKAAFEMGRDMKKFNQSYDDVKMYVYMLLTQPANVIGADVASVVHAAQGAGALPSQIEVGQLSSLVKDKATSLKDIKDAAVKNSVMEFIRTFGDMTTALAAMPPAAAKLLTEGAALPDKLEKEMTGLQKAKLPKVLDKVSDGKSNLENVQAEAPKLGANITEMVNVLNALVAALGS
ncbi:hypothetical protein HUU42_15175 [bacterium]|nr:hypothetical protein [bacterium]